MIVFQAVIVIVVVVFDFEEFRLDVEDTVEIEGAPVQHRVERDVALFGGIQLRIRVDRADARLDFAQFRGRDEIDLVENDDVGEGDLVFRFRGVAQPGGQPFGVGDGDDGVEPRGGAHVLVDEEGLGDRRGIGEARRLQNDRVEFALALHQPFENADQVAAHGTADAAVVHLEHFFVGADHQLVVDADLAEFVDDDGVALAVRLAQDAVQQRRLARPEVAGEDGDGYFAGLSIGQPWDSVRRKSCDSHISAGAALG